HHSAQILKNRLLERETTQEKVEDSETLEEQPKPIIKISLSSLLKVGLTSNYGRSLAILLAFFFTIYDNVRDFVENEMLTEEQIEQYIVKGTMFGFLTVFAVLFAVTFLINLIRTIIRYFDLEIVKQRNSLLISY